MYDYQKAIIDAFTEVANTLSSVHNTEELLKLREAQKAALQQSASTAQLLYRAGKASYFEVLHRAAEYAGGRARADRRVEEAAPRQRRRLPGARRRVALSLQKTSV